MTAIKSILPPNATALEKDFEQTFAQRLAALNGNLRYINNPDLCPSNLLPWLAWAVSVDVWSNSWTDSQKRAVIRESVQVHRTKGTLGALKRALAAFVFSDIRIEEWFEYGGEPYMFRVYAIFREDGLSMDDADLIYNSIMQTKNLRSHLEYFRPELETENKRPKVGIAFGHLETTTIYPREDNV